METTINNIPKVSILAINYNNSPYVIETLDSIAAQTYSNIELIIADDASTDDSLDKIKQWLKNYTRPYKLIENKKNLGVCGNLNSALNVATGEYISCIATDDAMLPEKTETQLKELMKKPSDYGMIYSDGYLMNHHSQALKGNFIEKFKPPDFHPEGDVYSILLIGNYIPAMSVLIKKEVFDTVGLFDTELVYEDWDMWLRIAQKYKIAFSDFKSIKYRIREGSLSSTIHNFRPSMLRIYLKHLGSVQNKKTTQEAVNRIIKHAFKHNDFETLNVLKSAKNKSFLMSIISILYPLHLPKPVRHLISKTHTLWNAILK